MFSDLFPRVTENVRQVREQIDAAVRRSGRTGDSVRLVAVSKYARIGDGMVEAFLAAGCRELGEARPQLLVEKAEYYGAISDGNPIYWHLIGSLQRNKVRKTISDTALIHSLDSLRLAEAVDRIAGEENLSMPVRCLLEIAISGDETKQGFEPEDVLAVVDNLGKLKNLRIDGLMCMSGLDSSDDETRRQFESVRRLSETLQERGLPPNVSMDELSMGMSDDFEIAVEEGATIVRVGSRLYS